MKKKVVLRRIHHGEKWRIAIMFDYDARLKEIVRSIAGSAFSGTNRCFYVDDSEENLKLSDLDRNRGILHVREVKEGLTG